MTLAESEALAAAFGGATVDLYGEQALRAQLRANQAAGTEGVAPHIPDALAAVATQASAEIVGTAWQQARTTHERTEKLFSNLSVPDLQEFARAGVDFAGLQAGFEGYEQAGMHPELVFAPVNLPLAQWRAMYSRLREWQDKHHPNSAYRLKKQNDGDGLYVWDGVKDAWDSLSQQAVNQTPGKVLVGDAGIAWKALVVPTASREDGGLAVNTSHDLSTQNIADQFEATQRSHATESDAHMPIGAYLTLQATRVMEDAPLMDKDTWTWAAGTYDNGARAPALSWNPVDGRVSVRNDAVGDADDVLGVRLPVWG